jgi:malonyl-CoA/methylmalonyl-CoA synthetase
VRSRAFSGPTPLSPVPPSPPVSAQPTREGDACTSPLIEVDSSAAWNSHGLHGSADALTRDLTLVHAWRRHWAERPDAAVLIDAERGTSLDGATMEARTADAACRFTSAGLTRGDRVLMSCAPSVELVIAHAGALRAGLTVVPVNTAFTRDELANVATAAEARLAVLDEPARAPNGLPICGVDLDGLGADLDGLGDGSGSALPVDPDDLRADDPALLLFTSGTTGRPKGALLSHANVLASAVSLRIAWAWEPSDRLVLCLPLFHMHGLGVGVHGTMLAGASAVIVSKFSPDAVFDAVAAHDANMLFGVPTMWIRLLDSDRVAELRSLRCCVSGSAALAPEVWHGLAEKAGQEVIERYGMTETVMLTSNPLHGQRRPGSVGRPLPGVRLAIESPGPDGVGEIVVRGPNVFSGYLDRPDANAEAFTGSGWFRTGDLGRVDADGYVSIVGRSKDLIITGGYNVYPLDIEEVISALGIVAEVAVIGEPSTEWGETVTACIVTRAGDDVDLDALASAVTARLAGYQRPRRYVVVDELPRNALGKVVKAELSAKVRVS